MDEWHAVVVCGYTDMTICRLYLHHCLYCTAMFFSVSDMSRGLCFGTRRNSTSAATRFYEQTCLPTCMRKASSSVQAYPTSSASPELPDLNKHLTNLSINKTLAGHPGLVPCLLSKECPTVSKVNTSCYTALAPVDENTYHRHFIACEAYIETDTDHVSILSLDTDRYVQYIVSLKCGPQCCDAF